METYLNWKAIVRREIVIANLRVLKTIVVIFALTHVSHVL